ncbi:MAG TPA: dihydrofolate reductase [Saprospiraceae bacterium]|nr:dihydrofolate reductase [Saprospiraceae bacterium]HMQ83411.1 dihydrofolate reductase [Saprospiraceae bacterium]
MEDKEMIVSAIVAADLNNVIGKDNGIPWYLSGDLKYFKKTTLDHHIIMGRKSFQSIGHALPKRTNVVITRDPFFVASNCLVARSVEEALNMAYDNGEEEAFIIGGGEIYKQSMPWWDKVYLTRVNTAIEGGDTFFPILPEADWELLSTDPHDADEKNDFPYTFQLYQRR